MADCFRLFYKRICCDVCCCQQCARKREKLKQRRRREIAAQRNERFSAPAEPEEVTAVTIGATEALCCVTQPDSVDRSDDRVLLDAHSLSNVGIHPSILLNFAGGCGAFTNIRETAIIDDEPSVSQLSVSRNDLRDVDVYSDPARAGGSDDESRRLLKNFLDSKETDIVSDPRTDVTARGRCRNRLCDSGKQQEPQKPTSTSVSPTTVRYKTDTEVKVLFDRQQTANAAHESGKAKKSSKLHKSKSFTHADKSTSRDCVRRTLSRSKLGTPQSMLNQSAADSSGVSPGSRKVLEQPTQSTNSNRVLTKDAAKSARKDGKVVAKGQDVGAEMQSRVVFSVSDGRDNSRKRKLVRSQSSKMSKTERRPLRRNVTMTATDIGVGLGGIAVGNLMHKVRRQMVPNLPLKKPSPRPPRHGSMVSSDEDCVGSQESFVTAHGDSVFQLDSESPHRSSANFRRTSNDSNVDDNDDDNCSLSYNQERPSPSSRNSHRCEKSVDEVPTSADGQGPVVCRADEEDPEDDVVLVHMAEAKVSVPISICLIIITAYIIAGSALFAAWENWDYLTGSYFCFITLSTIGFGDVVPGTDMDQWSSHEKLVLCALWLAFGLSLLAMCFNLMQEEVKEKCKRIGRKLGLLKVE